MYNSEHDICHVGVMSKKIFATLLVPEDGKPAPPEFTVIYVYKNRTMPEDHVVNNTKTDDDAYEDDDEDNVPDGGIYLGDEIEHDDDGYEDEDLDEWDRAIEELWIKTAIKGPSTHDEEFDDNYSKNL